MALLFPSTTPSLSSVVPNFYRTFRGLPFSLFIGAFSTNNSVDFSIVSDDEDAFPDMKKKKKKAIVVCENKLDTPKFSKKFSMMFTERDELYELEGEKDGNINPLILVRSIAGYLYCSLLAHTLTHTHPHSHRYPHFHIYPHSHSTCIHAYPHSHLHRLLVGLRPGSSGLGVTSKRPPSRSIADVLSDARRMTLQAQVSINGAIEFSCRHKRFYIPVPHTFTFSYSVV